jgi:hypothetical protein
MTLPPSGPRVPWLPPAHPARGNRDVRAFADDEERVSFVLGANLFRRHLSRAQRNELVTKLRERGSSLRRIGEAVGVHHETVRAGLAGVGNQTAGPAKVVGGTSRPTWHAGPRPPLRSSSLRRGTRPEHGGRSRRWARGPLG